MKLFNYIVLFFFFAGSLYADEGMWLLTQLPSLELQKKGLQLDNEDIYHSEKSCIVKAIILLGGGTSSFVHYLLHLDIWPVTITRVSR